MSLERIIGNTARKAAAWNRETEYVAVSNLLGAATAITAGYVASKTAAHYDPEVTSLIATVADISAYYTAFITSNGFFNREKRLKDRGGKYRWKKITGFVSEKLAQNIAIDKVYGPVRAFAQYELDKRGVLPEQAALMIQGSATAILTVVWPTMQFVTCGVKNAVKKVCDRYRGGYGG